MYASYAIVVLSENVDELESEGVSNLNRTGAKLSKVCFFVVYTCTSCSFYRWNAPIV